ncbi:S23 ribosomal protein [Halobacteroides halobius DSM 5150]|uniref:S23 ribosomal protein n=1 Tax=Halobacteroides halobius (strain ATCC 35273 / DSM 5150 / MD-1) TaxID=748449 RepID=L0KAV3_HALHC|nr:four helix bundle protein [Halobacteroides halobius]AGB42146.1 S23 ribosomal protein [Halobacteroides halobius DSM 5150]
MKYIEDLDVFQKAHKLTIDLYKTTDSFPKEEKYGLVSQIRRASSSINSNLMEGSHRKTQGEYKQFVGIARGSVGELKYHILLAKDLDYISEEKYLEFKERINQISKMLAGLMRSIK